MPILSTTYTPDIETIIITDTEQGPPGPAGSPGFSTPIDEIDGGSSFDDFGDDAYEFDGGDD